MPSPERRSRPARIHLLAVEESGDRLGGALMRALRERLAGDVRFAGLGGSDMQAAGLPPCVPLEELAIIGLTAIPARLPKILRHIREAANAICAEPPDALVIIDSPDFTHRVARKVRARVPGVPIIDYVSPSVWAWRPGRAKAMRAYVDHILALLPFEPEVHRQLGGPPCTYVGHPLIEASGALRPSAAEAERRSGHPPIVLALPGSRRGELARLTEPFGVALYQVAARSPIEVVLPTLAHLQPEVEARTAGWRVRPRIVVGEAERQAAFRVARAALAASGTVTLELAVAGVPTVAAYKVAPIEAFVARRVLRIPSVILANLVLGENVVPEFLQEACTPEALATALLEMLPETPSRARQAAAFGRLDQVLDIGGEAPSSRAAAVVLDVIAKSTQDRARRV